MSREFMRGIYLHDGFVFEPKERCPFYWRYEDWKRYLDWLASIGINAIEFCTQAAFLRKPSTALEFNRIGIMKKMIQYAHQKGMKVWYIVASNVLSNVPDGTEPTDQGKKNAYEEPCPKIPEKRKKIIEAAAYYIEQYKGIDAFELFAGDWGGCNCGICDYNTYLELAKDYYEVIKKVNPGAEVYLNTWAISYWQKFDKENPSWGKVFDDEAKYSLKVMESLKSISEDLGISLPFHHFYRPLAISGRDEDACPFWPDKQMIEELHAQGRKVFAWPHFIMENDPGHVGRWGFMHARLAYLRALIAKLKQLNVDGIMGNLYNPQLQPLSAYAFAVITGDANVSDEKILTDFASLLVDKKDVEKLYDVLAYMENNDPWEADLPAAWRKKHVECKICRNEAVEMMKRIVPLDKNPGNLQLSPADCLRVIESTLEQLPEKPMEGSLS